MKFIVLLLFTFLNFGVNAQSIVGFWENKDDKTGKVDSIVEVYKKEEKLYVKIHDILFLSHKNDICIKCKDERKDKPILGLDIIKPGLYKDHNKWVGGKILDARNGREYDVYLQLINKNKIKVRGYLGLPIFGRNAYWKRSNKH